MSVRLSSGNLLFIVEQGAISNHIGDLGRGIGPDGAQAPGTEILFSRKPGVLFLDEGVEDGVGVGIRPDAARDIDWLDPKALYRAHDDVADRYPADWPVTPARTP